MPLKNYRPLLLQNLALTMPGLRVHQLRLNQHTPEAVWTAHSHEHGQALVYLTGRGRQEMEGKVYECRPGTVIWVPPGISHAFVRDLVRPPLVLVVDLDLEITRSTPHPCVAMPVADLTRVKTSISRLFQIRQAEQRESILLIGSIVLETLDRVLFATGWLKPFNRFGDRSGRAITQFMERLVTRLDGPDVSLEKIASHAGYALDQLNRKLKGECGLTLGQLRSRLRLQRAQNAIRQGLPIQTAAERIGILDNNYFSRWFRQQTGMTPTQWKKSPPDSVRL